MNNKATTEKLVKEIEITRIKLHNLISEKSYNLLDSEVIKLSQLLDKLLSEYEDLK
ncbi:aspartyl-phosphate phosphatase Spo0E family protein [Tissierella sp. MB52-C2]|uniref:aspartyl-phosphate phosphatase Spo0E family protein n=1 Tax=Tissierella sp. MB52-C2 TaxID=3070999 RepID=UPI00280AE69B|nr:aspartyl-phosphate phosphatase Spo0E family protein [Tissierella sp. MB52-C2]WMM25650.1 aspartyl-phosphate phosphatase Spo0E family protein [Tissierella sp. MB52-C2]